MREPIDNIEKITLDAVTAKDLRIHYFTGRNEIHGRGRDKVTAYRHGIQTDIGDIEILVWIEAARAVIHRDSHDGRLAQLAESNGMSAMLSDSSRLKGREKGKVFPFANMLASALQGDG